MATWLSRMFTIPHHQRDEINAALSANPALLAVVNGLKDSLITAAVHEAVGANPDPLAAALAAVAISSQIERAIPTPPSPVDQGAAATPGTEGTMLNLINSMAPSVPPGPPAAAT